MKHERVAGIQSCMMGREADGLAAGMIVRSPNDEKYMPINHRRRERRGICYIPF